ncbi:hypothetical protein U5B43_08950 [Campylobacter sp. 9BO]|uniref:hypothetical protein n=1 Tax=Campylobacter sp. 9BO TaxID=3424759 RepID=UPI003D32703D
MSSIESQDYDFMKKEELEQSLTVFCDEYESKVQKLIDSISCKLVALRGYYEPLIGFENIDEIEQAIWDNRL